METSVEGLKNFKTSLQHSSQPAEISTQIIIHSVTSENLEQREEVVDGWRDGGRRKLIAK